MHRNAIRLTTALALVLVLSAAATAAETRGEMSLTIEQHRFTPEEIRIKSGQPFDLVITNKDPAAEEFESQDLRIERVVPAGKTVRLRIPAVKTGTYDFVGEYHSKTAKGRIVAE